MFKLYLKDIIHYFALSFNMLTLSLNTQNNWTISKYLEATRWNHCAKFILLHTMHVYNTKENNNAYFLSGVILCKSSEDHIRFTAYSSSYSLYLLKTRSMCLWCMKYSQRVAFQVCHIMYIFIYNWNCAGKISDFHTEYWTYFISIA